MKSSLLSMNQSCGEMSCMGFSVEYFPARATAQGELHWVPSPSSESSSSQGHVPHGTVGIWCGIGSLLYLGEGGGHHWAKRVPDSCLLPPDSCWPNEQVCFITLDTQNPRKERQTWQQVKTLLISWASESVTTDVRCLCLSWVLSWFTLSTSHSTSMGIWLSTEFWHKLLRINYNCEVQSCWGPNSIDNSSHHVIRF